MGVCVTNCWISVCDELPPDDVALLVYNGTSVYIATHKSTGNEHWIEVDDEFWCELNKITHWQPLPQPPKK